MNGQPTARPLLAIEKAQAGPLDSNGLGNGLVNGLVNGHASGHASSSELNNRSFEPQGVSRTLTENHQSLVHRPKASMIRSKTNYEPGNLSSMRETSVEERVELRHGWEEEYNSSAFLGHLNSVYHPVRSAIFTEPG